MLGERASSLLLIVPRVQSALFLSSLAPEALPGAASSSLPATTRGQVELRWRGKKRVLRAPFFKSREEIPPPYVKGMSTNVEREETFSSLN